MIERQRKVHVTRRLEGVKDRHGTKNVHQPVVLANIGKKRSIVLQGDTGGHSRGTFSPEYSVASHTKFKEPFFKPLGIRGTDRAN